MNDLSSARVFGRGEVVAEDWFGGRAGSEAGVGSRRRLLRGDETEIREEVEHEKQENGEFHGASSEGVRLKRRDNHSTGTQRSAKIQGLLSVSPSNEFRDSVRNKSKESGV